MVAPACSSLRSWLVWLGAEIRLSLRRTLSKQVAQAKGRRGSNQTASRVSWRPFKFPLEIERPKSLKRTRHRCGRWRLSASAFHIGKTVSAGSVEERRPARARVVSETTASALGGIGRHGVKVSSAGRMLSCDGFHLRWRGLHRQVRKEFEFTCDNLRPDCCEAIRSRSCRIARGESARISSSCSRTFLVRRFARVSLASLRF